MKGVKGFYVPIGTLLPAVSRGGNPATALLSPLHRVPPYTQSTPCLS